MYLQDVSAVAPTYRIKSNSCLNELFFFMWQNFFMWLLPDLVHDVFEGFAFDFMSGIIGVLVEQKCFTLQELNNRISTFEYAHIDQTKRKQHLKIISSVSFKLKETACEMWDLIRLFPAIIGD